MLVKIGDQTFAINWLHKTVGSKKWTLCVIKTHVPRSAEDMQTDRAKVKQLKEHYKELVLKLSNKQIAKLEVEHRIKRKEFLMNDALASAKSYLHKGDVFSKDTGRKKSLGKAIGKLELIVELEDKLAECRATPCPPDVVKAAKETLRAVRSAFWDAYFTMTNAETVERLITSEPVTEAVDAVSLEA